MKINDFTLLKAALIFCTLFAAAGCSTSHRIALFDGSDFSKWTDVKGNPVQWKLSKGTMEIVPGTGSIVTKKSFQDFRMHIEFNLPEDGKTNSGVYIQRRYEVQIIDSYGKDFRPGMCASLYKQKSPDQNVCKKPGQWQSYDIFFRAARYKTSGDKSEKTQNARITVLHNNVLVHDDAELLNKTGSGQPEGPDPDSILLQDHGGKIRFRNIWIIPQ